MAVATAFRSPASFPRLISPISATGILLKCASSRNFKANDRSLRSPQSFSSPTFRSFPPLISGPTLPQLPYPGIAHSSIRRLFCSQTISVDGELGIEVGEEVRKFKKRLRIVDLKGGPDEGLDRVGQSITIRGWVRTCRVQSSVTFIEVNLLY